MEAFLIAIAVMILLFVVIDAKGFGRWVRDAHEGYQQGTTKSFNRRKELVRSLYRVAKRRPSPSEPA